MSSPSVIAYKVMKRAIISIVLYLCLFQQVMSQKIIALETRYNNSFREWTIITDDEEIEGELRMRWAFKDDWTAWDLRIGDVAATIEQKWTDDPNLWIVRCQGKTVNAKTAWAGEFHRWKIGDGQHYFNWESRYANIKEEWEIDTNDENSFQMYTSWKGDPRDWTVVDQLPEEVSLAMKVAMIFLTLHFSTPRI